MTSILIPIKGGIHACWTGTDLYTLRTSDPYTTAKPISLNHGIMMQMVVVGSKYCIIIWKNQCSTIILGMYILCNKSHILIWLQHFIHVTQKQNSLQTNIRYLKKKPLQTSLFKKKFQITKQWTLPKTSIKIVITVFWIIKF